MYDFLGWQIYGLFFNVCIYSHVANTIIILSSLQYTLSVAKYKLRKDLLLLTAPTCRPAKAGRSEKPERVPRNEKRERA